MRTCVFAGTVGETSVFKCEPIAGSQTHVARLLGLNDGFAAGNSHPRAQLCEGWNSSALQVFRVTSTPPPDRDIEARPSPRLPG